MPGFFVSTQADAHSVVTAVGAPNLKMLLDCYHMQVMEGDLTTKLKRYLPDCGHVQIAGPPGRNEPDTGEVRYSISSACWTRSATRAGSAASIVPRAKPWRAWAGSGGFPPKLEERLMKSTMTANLLAEARRREFARSLPNGESARRPKSAGCESIPKLRSRPSVPNCTQLRRAPGIVHLRRAVGRQEIADPEHRTATARGGGLPASELGIPVLRWPGGCFADDYHWRRRHRPRREAAQARERTGAATSRTTASAPTNSSACAG